MRLARLKNNTKLSMHNTFYIEMEIPKDTIVTVDYRRSDYVIQCGRWSKYMSKKELRRTVEFLDETGET